MLPPAVTKLPRSHLCFKLCDALLERIADKVHGPNRET
jgi:hypothetical protein